MEDFLPARRRTSERCLKRILVALILSMTFSAPLVGQAARTAKIHGQVLLSSAGQLPEVMRVTLYTSGGSYLAAKTLTTETSFIFEGVALGSYELTVESPGFHRSSKVIVVSSPTSRYEMMVTIPLGAPLQPRADRTAQPPTGQETVDAKTLEMPAAATNHMKKAGQEARKGNPRKAISHLEKAAEIFPEGYQIYNNLAVHYLAVGELEKAVAALQESILRNPDDATSRRNLAQLHLTKGEYEAALEQLDASLALDSKSSKCLMLLGETHLGLGNCEMAMDYYEAAVEINPEDRSYLGMGQCYAQLGQLEQAVAELKAFLAKHPTDPRADQVEALIRQIEN